MKKTSKFRFSKAFSELEEIAEWFEKEEIDLEEGLKKFERGLKLAKELQERLGLIENKVEEIKDKFQETVLQTDE